jgi:hypothetical protein
MFTKEKREQMKSKIKTKRSLVFIILVASLVFTSCAPAGNTHYEYGFFYGIWHGNIALFALIGKLFGADIGIYAENNSGFLYVLGYLIGLGIIGGGGRAAARRRF